MQAVDLNQFIAACQKARKKRVREENQRKHKERRAPGWDDTLPRVVFSISEVAKRTGLRRGELFARMEAAGWIRREPATQAWAACDGVIASGLMATRRKTIGWGLYAYQAVITPSGCAELVHAGIAVAGERDGQQR